MTTLRLTALSLSFFFFADVAIAAQPEKKDQPVDTPEVLIPVPTSARTLSLAECLEIGQNQRPVVRAAVSSLKSAESGLQALNNLPGFARFVSPDLPFRKKQGEQGVQVASADVAKVQQETKYDITRMYFSFVYARQQDNTAGDIVSQLEVYYEVAKGLAKEPGTNIDQFKLYLMREQINEVRKLRIDARVGQSMALAALKEAMGVEQTFDFLPRDQELPVMGGTVTQDQVICFAVNRRPEIAMAAAGVDAFKLEVCAQNAVRVQQKVQTLAIGSDLHSRLVPMAHRNGDYRPGALSPEMPTILVGSRKDRVAHAREISDRQDSLFDTTRNLVTLEATNTFFAWQKSTEKMRKGKASYEDSKRIAEQARINAQATRNQEMLIRFQAMEGKYQSEYVTAVFEHLLALAALERVTSGGVCPEFTKAADASK